MDALLKSALVGAAKSPPPPPDASHPADAAFVGAEPGRSFLLRAGAQAVWRRAGLVPRRDVPALAACLADEWPAAPESTVPGLRAAFTGESKDLLPEFLAALVAAGRRLPPALLPEALSPVAKSQELRRLVRAALGERGRWLARLNPDWSWAASEEADATDLNALRRRWEEGTVAERIEALTALREADPAVGRDWLAEGFKAEKADVRARLLAAISVGLSTDDEPFLEAALDDRSETVRTEAADLLARLPASRLVARMTERADAMLSAERSGLLKKTLSLTCTPPEELGKDWLRDGVPKTPPHGVGKRALWTETVLGCVPPERWSERFGATPAALVAAALNDKFGTEIVTGWTHAVVRHAPADDAWPLALWDYWIAAFSGWYEEHVAGTRRSVSPPPRAPKFLEQLISCLPAAAVEGRLRPRLRRDAGVGVAPQLLPLLPRPWSEAFARAWLEAVAPALAVEPTHRGSDIAHTLSAAATALPGATLDEAVARLEPIAESNGAFRGQTAWFLSAVRTRAAFHRALAADSS